MDVWRIQLKPDKERNVSYSELLEFCKNQNIIGVGWTDIEERFEDANDDRLRYACKKYDDGNGGYLSAYNEL